MKKIKDLIARHKFLTVMSLITLIFVLIMAYFLLYVFIGGNNKYGDRLNGIEEVEITENKMQKIEEKITEKNEVNKVSIRIQGKIVYINITFNNDVSLDKDKDIASSTLDEFAEDEKEYYDFGYFLTQVGGEEDKTYFNVTGTKHAKADKISFIKS